MKPLRELTEEDLRRCPIWRYEGASDAVALISPVADFAESERRAYIARTRFILADDSVWWGYCSPTDDSGLDYVQPVLMVTGGAVRFWYDEAPPEPEPERTCRLLGKTLQEIFPARFECLVAFEGRFVAGELYRIEVLG